MMTMEKAQSKLKQGAHAALQTDHNPATMPKARRKRRNRLQSWCGSVSDKRQ
jgi:hypothetical protein